MQMKQMTSCPGEERLTDIRQVEMGGCCVLRMEGAAGAGRGRTHATQVLRKWGGHGHPRMWRCPMVAKWPHVGGPRTDT